MQKLTELDQSAEDYQNAVTVNHNPMLNRTRADHKPENRAKAGGKKY